MNGLNEAGLLLGPIIGGLAHDRVILWGRSSGPAENPQALHAWLGARADLAYARLAGKSAPLSSQDGYTGIVHLLDLDPNTRYYYNLTLDPAAPTPGNGPMPDGRYPSFKTFPKPGEPAAFSFAFGSCINPMEGSSDRIFNSLDERRQVDDLRFILLLGDQVYADDFNTNSLEKVAQTLDEYRDVYTQTWREPALQRLLWNFPAFMTLDDHEVDDDWRWRDSERRVGEIPWWNRLQRLFKRRPLSEGQLPLDRVQAALQAYWEHQGKHAPPILMPLSRDDRGRFTLTADDPGSLAYTFQYGHTAFFMLDTRTGRVRGSGHKRMLSEGQWSALETWLLAVKDAYPVKFLVTSSSLLFRSWIDVAQDRWAGYPKERERLLHFLAANGIQGVYLLAGDMHSAHAVCAELYGPGGKPLVLWEFCSSPFKQVTNQWARYTYLPMRKSPVKRQRCEFIHSKINFGLVKVSYPADLKPRVNFELYGENGVLIDQAGE